MCFCSIWERTDSWIAIGVQLAKRDFGVYHVVTPKDYLDEAMAHGVPRENILWLRIDEALAQPVKPETIAKIADYERKTGVRLKHFLLMDRFLRVRPFSEQMQYAAYCFEKLHEFYDKHDIQLVSGEPTDTHDLISLLICRATGRHYAAPFDMRFPGSRMILWDSDREEKPLIVGAKTPDDVTEAEIAHARTLRDSVLNRARMDFSDLREKAPSLGTGFIKRITRGTLYRALIRSRHDGHMYKFKDMFVHHKYHMIPINHRLNRLVWKKLFDAPVAGEKFVLYTLNYAPEHSLDVEAPYYTNTYETVKNIARTLPSDVKLYVKEHPHALGIRGPKELKQIKSIPGVRLIEPGIDSHDLLTKAEMTVSLSGTVSQEAGLYGRKCGIFGDIYIQNFATVEKLDYPWQVGESLQKPQLEPNVEADVRYIAWLYSNSSNGSIKDRISYPDSMLPENISACADTYEICMNNIKNGVNQARPLLDGSTPWLKS